jgi:hypothetical protein
LGLKEKYNDAYRQTDREMQKLKLTEPGLKETEKTERVR